MKKNSFSPVVQQLLGSKLGSTSTLSIPQQQRQMQTLSSQLLSLQENKNVSKSVTSFMMNHSKQLTGDLLFHDLKVRSVSSVSISEVSKFSKMSQDWWNPSKNPLIGMNPIRIQYIKQHTSIGHSLEKENTDITKVQEKHALDVGCGAGILSESLRRIGYNVTAIDPSADLIRCARQHSLKSGLDRIDYRNTSIEKLFDKAQEEELKFDVICILEVLEHVDNIPSMLRAASSLLKNDGKLFISTLNRTTISYLLAIVGAEYIMRYLEPGTHDWKRFLSPAEVEQYMEQAGLEQAHISGMVLKGLPPPVCASWDWTLSKTDLDVNWIGTYQHR